MNRKERLEGILGWFGSNMKAAESELRFDGPYQLAVAVMLSAQCTDKRINQVTPAFFLRFPDVKTLSGASVEEVYDLIKSVSYPNSKAAHLVGMAKKVMSDFSGEIPSDTDALQTLPGVGRKTANVIASIIWGAPVIAVDTHVFRISHRLGIASGNTPEKVEEELEAGIPAPLRAKSHHWLILHGRYVCTARAPKCASCGLAPWCAEFRKNHKPDRDEK